MNGVLRPVLDAIRGAQLVLVLFIWPLTGAAVAASPGLGAAMNMIQPADWFWLFALSGISGLVSLLHRVRSMLEEAAAALGKEPPNSTDPSGGSRGVGWRMFAACHMTGAMFVGPVVFFLLESVHTNPMLEVPAIAVCSWAGSKVADKWVSAFGDRIMGVLSRRSP